MIYSKYTLQESHKQAYNYKLSLNKFILKQYHIVVFSDMLGWS